MRDFFSSLAELTRGILKWIIFWGPLVVFDSIDAYQKFVVPNLPIWAEGYVKMFPDPTQILIGAVFVLAVGSTYHTLRLRLPENLKFNMTIRDAIEYLREKSDWGVEIGRSPRAGYTGAALELRQAARDGRLFIDGKKEISRSGTFSFANVWERIAADYWQTHEIDIVKVFDDDTHWPLAETQPEDVTDQGAKTRPRYTFLRVSPRQVEYFWRKRAMWRRIWGMAKRCWSRLSPRQSP